MMMMIGLKSIVLRKRKKNILKYKMKKVIKEIEQKNKENKIKKEFVFVIVCVISLT